MRAQLWLSKFGDCDAPVRVGWSTDQTDLSCEFLGQASSCDEGEVYVEKCQRQVGGPFEHFCRPHNDPSALYCANHVLPRLDFDVTSNPDCYKGETTADFKMQITMTCGNGFVLTNQTFDTKTGRINRYLEPQCLGEANKVVILVQPYVRHTDGDFYKANYGFQQEIYITEQDNDIKFDLHEVTPITELPGSVCENNAIAEGDRHKIALPPEPATDYNWAEAVELQRLEPQLISARALGAEVMRRYKNNEFDLRRQDQNFKDWLCPQLRNSWAFCLENTSCKPYGVGDGAYCANYGKNKSGGIRCVQFGTDGDHLIDWYGTNCE